MVDPLKGLGGAQVPGAIGDEALTEVLTRPGRLLAGGRLLDGVGRGELLSRLRLGAFEAGALPSAGYNSVVYIQAAAVGYLIAYMEVPPGVAARVTSMTGLLVTAALGFQPTPFIGVGVLHAQPIVSPTPMIVGAGCTANVPSGAIDACGWLATAGTVALPDFHVSCAPDSLVVQPSSYLVVGADAQAVGDWLSLSVTYTEAPARCRPAL